GRNEDDGGGGQGLVEGDTDGGTARAGKLAAAGEGERRGEEQDERERQARLQILVEAGQHHGDGDEGEGGERAEQHDGIAPAQEGAQGRPVLLDAEGRDQPRHQGGPAQTGELGGQGGRAGGEGEDAVAVGRKLARQDDGHGQHQQARDEAGEQRAGEGTGQARTDQLRQASPAGRGSRSVERGGALVHRGAGAVAAGAFLAAAASKRARIW